MRNVIVISGDIISYSSLNTDDKRLLDIKLKQLIVSLDTYFSVYAHLKRKNYIECVVKDCDNALQILLIIKCFIKSITLSNDSAYTNNHRIKSFKTYGIQLALGYGTLDKFQPKDALIEGVAIRRSKMLIKDNLTSNKSRIVIKKTLYFNSKDKTLNMQVNAFLSLIDTILSRATAKQCEVLYHKLMGHTEDEVSEILGISQSTVNQHSTSSGWNSIEATLLYFKALFSTPLK